MDIRGSLHGGQQTGVLSLVDRQIGVVWVVWIGDGCGQNRTLRSDTDSVRCRLAVLAVVFNGSRDPVIVIHGKRARYLHLLWMAQNLEPGWSRAADVVRRWQS